MALPRLLHRAVPDALACAALLAAAVALAALLTRTDVDPDRAYHHALSRLVAEQGLPRALPQVTGLHWNRAFSDKEFLFHQLTALGHRLAGERGVDAVGVGVTALALLAAYLCCRAFARPSVAAGLVLCLLVTQAHFAFRAALLRPYVLAVAAALLLVAGLLHRRGALAFAGAAVFGLAYHALYVPAALLGLTAAVGLALRERSWLRPALLGAAGLAVGAVANPYFPQTLEATQLTLDIALGRLPGPELLGAQGSELVRFSGVAFLWMFASGVLGAAVAVACLAVPRLRAQLPALKPAVLAVALAVAFLALGYVNPRASEYALPLVAVAVAATLPGLGRWGLVLLPVLLVVNLPALLKSNDPQPIDRYQRETREAVSHLPPDEDGFVFHCGFDEGSYLLDQRPRFTVVDVLDPLYLARLNPELARGRQALVQGRMVDPWAFVSGLGARYVVCGYPLAVEQLDRDLGFLRVWPNVARAAQPGEGAKVWRVLPQAAAQWRTGRMQARALEELRTFVPEPQALVDASAERVVTFPAQGEVSCGLLSPQHAPAGQQYVAVGGGPLWRLFRNGQLVGEGRGRQMAALGKAVELASPLSEGDALILLVCSQERAVAPWATLAFPSGEALEQRCAAMGRPGRQCP